MNLLVGSEAEGRSPIVAQLHEVWAGYGGPFTLQNLSLSLCGGHVFALCGPNGAGKSTVVRVLTGTLPCLRGSVQRTGVSSRGRRPVSLVPQEIALYPWLTAYENCVAFGRLDGMDARRARERAMEALRLCRSSHIAAKPVSRLSGGYCRRINIAVALMSDPALLILDEPTVGLDSEARHGVAEITKAVASSGAAVMVVTHDLEGAAPVADDVGILSGGKLLAQGGLKTLLNQTFAGRKVVELVYETTPGDPQQAWLRQSGAVRGASFRHWLAPTRDSYDLNEVLATYSANGWPPAEVRVREPGLADLYEFVLRDEAAA